MKTANPTMEAELALESTTLARLWTITPQGGTPLRFTDHDADITRGGDLYRSSKSFMASAISNTIAGASSNLDITVLLSDTENSIAYMDLQRGNYDGADVTLELVSHQNPAADPLRLYAGVVGTVSMPTNHVGVLQLTGNLTKANKPLTENYTASCRADFGDARCGVNLAGYSSAFTVTDVDTKQLFTMNISPANYLYKFGLVYWLTGKNAGKATEVNTNLLGEVTLFFGMGHPIEVGDTGTIYRGCTKTVAACTAYANLANYRGEPYVPGDENIGV